MWDEALAMWYASVMKITQAEIDAALKEAHAAIRHAVSTREYHARRYVKGSSMREQDLQTARDRLKKAMLPLRSWLGQAPYERNPTHAHEEITERVQRASREIQAQRRRLWKMQKRK